MSSLKTGFMLAAASDNARDKERTYDNGVLVDEAEHLGAQTSTASSGGARWSRIGWWANGTGTIEPSGR